MNDGSPLSGEWLVAWDHAILIEEAKEQEQFSEFYAQIPKLVIRHKTLESHLPLKFVTNARKEKVGKIGMSDKKFPKDCTRDCPHYHSWDMSVDDWTNVCDLLKVQVDDCDGDIIRYRCPLDSDKRYQNALQEGR